MKTLAQFKLEENIKSIDILKGKGRSFATVNDKQLVVSKECDMTKPLFVSPLSKFINGKDDTEGTEIVPNAFTLHNSSVVVEITI